MTNKTLAKNRKARFEYEIQNTIEDKLMNKYYRQLDILKMMQEERYDLAK